MRNDYTDAENIVGWYGWCREMFSFTWRFDVHSPFHIQGTTPTNNLASQNDDVSMKTLSIANLFGLRVYSMFFYLFSSRLQCKHTDQDNSRVFNQREREREFSDCCCQWWWWLKRYDKVLCLQCVYKILIEMSQLHIWNVWRWVDRFALYSLSLSFVAVCCLPLSSTAQRLDHFVITFTSYRNGQLNTVSILLSMKKSRRFHWEKKKILFGCAKKRRAHKNLCQPVNVSLTIHRIVWENHGL